MGSSYESKDYTGFGDICYGFIKQCIFNPCKGRGNSSNISLVLFLHSKKWYIQTSTGYINLVNATFDELCCNFWSFPKRGIFKFLTLTAYSFVQNKTQAHNTIYMYTAEP